MAARWASVSSRPGLTKSDMSLKALQCITLRLILSSHRSLVSPVPVRTGRSPSVCLGLESHTHERRASTTNCRTADRAREQDSTSPPLVCRSDLPERGLPAREVVFGTPCSAQMLDGTTMPSTYRRLPSRVRLCAGPHGEGSCSGTWTGQVSKRRCAGQSQGDKKGSSPPNLMSRSSSST